MKKQYKAVEMEIVDSIKNDIITDSTGNDDIGIDSLEDEEVDE